MATDNLDLFIIKKQLLKGDFKYILRLDRNKNCLDVLKKTSKQRLFEYHKIKPEFDVGDYCYFERCISFPCIFGKKETPSPTGLFQIEHKSEDEYISNYYPNHLAVKFFGYLVVFEDYFIHSNLYDGDATKDDMLCGKAAPVGADDLGTSGCIRVSQDNLEWLIKNIDIGTYVIL